ncbi:MAG: hypothetical protein L0387_21800 [Acidobacteria bacterium]|nr:hypothetical protein [Acidobacteriota bacterium]MCI0723114.1 hypothetical protein [Acidobacteriota bacterium]
MRFCKSIVWAPLLAITAQAICATASSLTVVRTTSSSRRNRLRCDSLLVARGLTAMDVLQAISEVAN